MRTPLLVSLSLLFASGCEQFYLNVDKDTAVDTGEEALTPNPTIDLSWAETGIEIELNNGSGYEFVFGMVESTTECSADTEYGCWTAEDCINGYITPQETFAHPSYCHPLSQSGTTLEYSESLVAIITKTDEVIQGSKTAFPKPSEDNTYEFSVTYYLQATSTGANPTIECWSWGVDPDYFINEGCKSPIPVRLNTTTALPRHQRFELLMQPTLSR
jgi:hypothetical protein